MTSSQNHIESLLIQHGPMTSSAIAGHLQADFNLSTDTARKRISRLKLPVQRLPQKILPKSENFFYLPGQQATERYWGKLQRALRETNSVHGYAIDALLARGGSVPEVEFDVISAAPFDMPKQISADRIMTTLMDTGFIERKEDPDLGNCIVTNPHALADVDFEEVRVRRLVESVVLDGIREWIKNLGLGSYHKVAIRGDDEPRMVGPFRWDLTSPSYIHPLKRVNGQPGFVVADVFSGAALTHFQIRYFIRKVESISAMHPSRIWPILVADEFTKTALREGKAKGIVMATPSSIFSPEVSAALYDLAETLRRSAEAIRDNPEKLAQLSQTLLKIEGSNGNLRGILFELIVAHLVQKEGAKYVDIRVKSTDPTTLIRSDIDVLQVHEAPMVTCIECKAKVPGGKATLREIKQWLAQLPGYERYLRKRSDFQNSKIGFEFWTTGKIEPDALQKLTSQKEKRVRTHLSWRDGNAVREMASHFRETSIVSALDNHFLKHPLAQLLETSN